MRRASEMGLPILGVGIRSMSEEEAPMLANPSIVHVDARTALTTTSWYHHLDSLPDQIYLTIDLDGLDPDDVSADLSGTERDSLHETRVPTGRDGESRFGEQSPAADPIVVDGVTGNGRRSTKHSNDVHERRG